MISHKREHSKRQDSHLCDARCSEHCVNTVREMQEASLPKYDDKKEEFYCPCFDGGCCPDDGCDDDNI